MSKVEPLIRLSEVPHSNYWLLY